jgi:exonuclease VII small subunit
MKNKNIQDDVKIKSLKEAKQEINDILNKLEKKDVNLDDSIEDFQKLIKLNKHVDYLFKKKGKEISLLKKKINDKKKANS